MTSTPAPSRAISGVRRVALLFAVAALSALGVPHSAAWAAHPCGELSLQRGTVRTARPLAAAEALEPADAACLEAVARAVAGLSGLRTVTVSVRLADAARAGGAGLRIGEVYTAALVRAGVRRSRISAVAPATGHGQHGQVTLAYTERRSSRPVAQLEALDGAVSAGSDPAALRPALRGARFPAETLVATGPGASAMLGLADGSRIRLSEGSRLLVGRMHLNEELERVVRLQLLAGDMTADVRTGGRSSVFDVATRTGVAGVRGTRFRLGLLDGDKTRLETLEGVVELGQGDAEPLRVSKGQGATLDAAGATQMQAELPAAPAVEGPKQGELARGATLTWQPAARAASYRVQLARDAEFLYSLRTLDATAPTLAVPEDLPEGRWFWRVAAVDSSGFTGPASKTYGVAWRP